MENMDPNAMVRALDKLLDYTASGIGAVAGPMLAPWQARRESEALRITAQGEADALRIIAAAQSDARDALVSSTSGAQIEVDIAETIRQRIQFQEEKRHRNIGSIVGMTAELLGDKEVPDQEPDYDWTARFFNEVQDVSHEELQRIWSNVLAGEVQKPGSTSVKTLGILKNLDKQTVTFFQAACSICVSVSWDGDNLTDVRIPSLGVPGPRGLPPLPDVNSLQVYGLDYNVLNLLNEHGLIISDYSSWSDYNYSVATWPSEHQDDMIVIPFQFQGKNWVLVPSTIRQANEQLKLSGVALTRSGRELSTVAAITPNDEYYRALAAWFEQQGLLLTEVESSHAQPADCFL